jgi:SAM-dependent methyltransferase
MSKESKTQWMAFWNERYAEPVLAYGEKANVFFQEELAKLTPGRLFLPAEGQGRNAVYAAELGWDVLAVDYAQTGHDRAMELAAQHGVSFAYEVGDLTDSARLEEWLGRGPFDAIGVVFMHLPPGQQEMVLQRIVKALKPGGHFICEVFSKHQLGNPSGGPQKIEMLTDPVDFKLLLKENFSELRVWEENVVLHEGPYHEGKGSVVRAIGVV